MANRFLNNIKINDSYTLPNADGTENQIIVTDGAGSLSFNDLNTVTQSITGVQSNFTYYEVKNSSGTAIAEFKAVRAVGTDGNSGHILIDEMVADGSVEARYLLGITMDGGIANGEIGRVVAFGEIDQINTLAFSDGDVLWCDPANNGDFTVTEPDGPNLKIPAAIVLNSATNGKIQVRVQTNEGIKDLYDTKIASQVDGDVLVWDNTTGVWFNDSTLNVDYTNDRIGIGTNNPQQALDVRSAISVGDSLQGDIYFSSVSNGPKITGVQPGLGGQLIISTSGSEKMRVTSGGNVGIGTTSPAGILHISSDSTPTLVISTKTANQANSGAISFREIESTSEVELRYDGANNAFKIWTSLAGNALSVLRANGNVGIGQEFPSTKLEVAGNTTGTLLTIKSYGGGVNDAAMRFYNENDGPTYTMGLDSSDSRFKIAYSLDGNNLTTGTKLVIDTDGDVGIGTTNPLRKLDVAGTARLNTVGATTPILDLTTVTSNDPFIRYYDENNGPAWCAGLDVSDEKYKISFDYDNISISSGTKLTIDTAGNVGIGTTSPSQKLDVVGSIEVSDGIYIGGTAAANKLDDYEEGTFDLGFVIAQFGSTTTYTLADFGGNKSEITKYVKIGPLVMVSSQFRYGSKPAAWATSGTLQVVYIGNLPFPIDKYANGNMAGGTMTSQPLATNQASPSLWSTNYGSNDDILGIHSTRTNGTAGFLTLYPYELPNTGPAGFAELRISFSYYTNS